MRAAVITFPGSNCDDDCVYALKKVGFEVDGLWHKEPKDLAAYSLVVLPGGFSYGDYLRCGAIAALSPIMEEVKRFAEKGGLVLATCNGFQMICEMGLLPGALARNESLRFVCKDIPMRVKTAKTPWTCAFQGNEIVTLPIAHGDGRYVISEEEYEKLVKDDRILLTYVDEKGNESAEANPNGSYRNIAGVCNEGRNVFGLMPHPERATDQRSKDGQKFWDSVTKFLREKAS